LAQAERHVVEAEKRVARQRKIVAELERDGHQVRRRGVCWRPSRDCCPWPTAKSARNTGAPVHASVASGAVPGG
jgi:hypothetical protein